MKVTTAFVVASTLFWSVSSAPGQARPVNQFQVTKVTRNLVTSPEFSYDGAGQYRTDDEGRWLQVEAEFTAAPEMTDELTVKYYVLVNGRLLTGEVTHVNVPAGRELRSVIYLPPRALARVAGPRGADVNAVQNVAVQLVQGGAVQSEFSLQRARPQWFAALPAVSGLLLNKNETPFAPLYWGRYEQIKSR